VIPRRRLAFIVGLLTALVLTAASLFIPVEVRHSAPFGFSQTLDARRGIAVNGGRITANYPNFNRIDLDLRAYTWPDAFDLTVHVRPDVAGAADVRTIPLGISPSRIPDQKATFDDPFVTIRFDPIADSAGKRYYVWIETGPRNREDILALWSIKSYSRVEGRDVIEAMLAEAPGQAAPALTRVALIVLMLLLVGTVGWLVAVLALPSARSIRRNGSNRE
jgi:hypothetical protein